MYPGGTWAKRPDFIGFESDLAGVQVTLVSNDEDAHGTSDGKLVLKAAVGAMRLRILVPPPNVSGVVRGDCRVRVSYCGRECSLRLPIQINFVGPISIEPNSLTFVANNPAALVGLTRQIVVRINENNAAPKITGPAWLAFDLRPQGNRRFVLATTVCRLPNDGDRPSEIVVTLGSCSATCAVTAALSEVIKAESGSRKD